MGNGNSNGNGNCDGNGDAALSLFIFIALLSLLCVSHHCTPPPPCQIHLTPSPSLRIPTLPTHCSHHCWLIVVCLWVGGARAMILSSLALPPPPPSSSSSFTYLACPTITRHILLGHHGWLIVIFKGGQRGECAFYRNHWVAGWLPGRKLCVHATFFDKTAPAAKKQQTVIVRAC